MAGSYHGVRLEPEDLVAAAHRARRPAAERTTLYDIRAVRARGGGIAPPEGVARAAWPSDEAYDRGCEHRQFASPARETSLFAGVEPLEVFVELLAGHRQRHDLDGVLRPDLRGDLPADDDAPRGDLPGYDAGRRRVRAVGSHGTSFTQLAGTAPDADQHADRPARAARGQRDRGLRRRSRTRCRRDYAELLGITTLVCTPLAAAGRAYGVICADRGGGASSSPTASATCCGRSARPPRWPPPRATRTRQQERARRLASASTWRARSTSASCSGCSASRWRWEPLRSWTRRARSAAARRCRRRSGDLRPALERPLAPLPPETGTTLRAELERLAGTPGAPV